MTSLRERLLAALHFSDADFYTQPDLSIVEIANEKRREVLTAVADVVEAGRDVLTDIEKHMPGWRDEADAPEELTALERALAKLEQALKDEEGR